VSALGSGTRIPSTFFSCNPLPDIRRTIYQSHSARFALRQELHGVAVRQPDFPHIQNNVRRIFILLEQTLQLLDVLGLQSTAQDEYPGSFSLCSLNLQGHGFVVGPFFTVTSVPPLPWVARRLKKHAKAYPDLKY